mmetsp:Transcript_16679/g.25080  ORF Transcript_16679/g.25080 Transcript_16679/m.25080 type:complete len:180 (+) Transcript_16679:40-579(+)
MGPKPNAKGQPKKSDNAMGAKIASIVAGDPDNLTCVQVNLNCYLDIILDFAKRNLVVKLDRKIESMNEAIQDIVSQMKDGSDTDGAQKTEDDKEKLVDIQSKLMQIRSSIQEASVSTLELLEGNAVLSCQEDLKVLGVDKMTSCNKYSIGVISTNEAGQLVVTPLVIGEEPIKEQPKKK